MKPSFLRSARLAQIPGVLHGFSTREGGVSQGAFAELNLSFTVGDDPSAVSTNRKHVLSALGRPDAAFVSLRQVHGARVVHVTREHTSAAEADGMWTRDPRAMLAVLVADCVPILLAQAEGQAVAAVHAGWRGTLAKVPSVAVGLFAAAGYPAHTLRAALGPAIGPCCFTVGSDVARTMREAFPDAGPAIAADGDAWRIDLWRLNLRTLVAAGVPEANIDAMRICTSCTSTLFSHRRDERTTGRQAGVIVCGAGASDEPCPTS